ncbi:MAG: FkbM family methyltransferase [Planctomycetaceae bacterium]
MRRAGLAARQDSFILANRGSVSTGGVLDDLLFEFALAQILSTVESPSIVQVGANTGDTSHDMREQLLKSRAAALLVEPQPDVFQILSANYADVPTVRLANVALSNTEGTQDLFKISQYADQFHKSGRIFGNSIASFDADHPWEYFLRNATEAGQGQPKGKILESVTVKCQTFGDLAAEHAIGKVDVLAVDTEGFDFEIIKMVDSAGLAPILIKYEHKHLPGGLVGAHQSWQFLVDRGYKIVAVRATGDTVAWKTSG